MHDEKRNDERPQKRPLSVANFFREIFITKSIGSPTGDDRSDEAENREQGVDDRRFRNGQSKWLAAAKKITKRFFSYFSESSSICK